MSQAASSSERRTFLLDNLSSLPGGCVETLSLTFGVLIAVRVFEAGQYAKAALVAAPSFGLLLSLFIVPLVSRIGVSVNRASAWIWFVSALSLGLAALFGRTLELFLVFVFIALVGVTLAIPLISQIYRKHYPGEKRGRLFAIAAAVRKVAVIAMATCFGWFLDKHLEGFPWLLVIYAVACVGMGCCVWAMDPVSLPKTSELRLFSALDHLRTDVVFRRLIVSWMILGFGNLICYALFVEYLANPIYGYDLSGKQVAFFTSSVPEVMVLLSVIGWGVVFDRVDFFLLRVTLNVLFIAGVLVFFNGHGPWALGIGIGLHGIARAGGNVAWSLWATKFAKPDHVAEYMSVHTFLCGLRGVAAPFFAFPLASLMSPQMVSWVGAGLMLLASVMIAPWVRFTFTKNGDVEAEPDPRVT